MSGTTSTASAGLTVSDVVNVGVTISPLATGTRNFGALMIAGPSAVIDAMSRIRQYTSMTGVGADFGTSNPEWQAASLFFSQSPQPSVLYIGRWLQYASPGLLMGALFNAAQAVNIQTTLQSISSGSFRISLNGTQHDITGLDFSGITNLNGAATIIQNGLTAVLAGSTCTWSSDSYDRFNLASGSTGTASAVSYGSTASSGTDISTLIGLTQSSGASSPVPGFAAESALGATQALLGSSLNNGDVYGFMFAPTYVTDITDAMHESVAGYTQSLPGGHVYGITSNDSAIPTNSTTDIASVLASLDYWRTFVQYSTTNAYAVASLYGRMFTVDFTANNSTTTAKFKQEPGVQPEILSETQAGFLNAKNCNVYAQYNNNVSIIQQGTMINGYFFDEVQGLDWLQNNVQVNLFNLLYQSTSKIPQTDAGTHLLVTNVAASLEQGVNNGLIAPGTWTSSFQFGSLQTGDVLSTGYYVYAPSIASQSQAQRETRISVPIQVACKLAGAIHFANVSINVNR
jgi:hypothetical protein